MIRPKTVRRLAIICVVFGLLLAPQGTRSALQQGRFVRPPDGVVYSAVARSYLQSHAVDGRVKIWVFFTDKGYFDQRGFIQARAASAVQLTDRAMKRRAKVGRAAVNHNDIPVRQTYVDRVLDRGVKLLYVSKWLNAAAVEIDLDRIDELAGQPFVYRIQPTATYTRQPVEEPSVKNLPSQQTTPRSLGASVLNYGLSQTQLDQINVPAAHALGYNGQGVLICMMDTGFRKTHRVFDDIIAGGRLLAEWDFVFGDGETQDDTLDVAGAQNHGTYTWSTCGGADDGVLYGPAYAADFILAKTEDIRSETIVEEYNWCAAMEWADSIGADVVSSSLSYSSWYTLANYDGDQCVTTICADMAAELGIVVCNSSGNSGPGASSLGAPVDADTIISVGAVTSSGFLTSFTSRGPTLDGRIKPEVCAQGQTTSCANAVDDIGYTTKSGTSLSTPLVAGAAAVVLSAHPDWTPVQVRDALMNTADHAGTPDNGYGWGIIDVVAAINYACTAPSAPFAPLASATNPCYDEMYDVEWAPVSGAISYELYENSALVYSGFDTAFTTSHTTGSFDYYVIARNNCDSSLGTMSATTTINDCRCHGDPVCDSMYNVFDVVNAVDEIFRSGTPPIDPSCTHITRNDVNCDCNASIEDVVALVDIAFRGGDPELLICNPCVQQCP